MPSYRALPFVLLLGLGGCNVIGALAAKAPKPEIEAAYKGLAGKSVGILVYADRSLLTDWTSLPLDLGNSVLNKLVISQAAKIKDVKDTTFPYPPASFVKFQKEHPELANAPITEFAPRLGVQRLIYVEVNELSTRAEGAIALYLGKMNVSMHVIEIDEHGVAKSVYDEDRIMAQFPEKATSEGVLNGNDRMMYGGVMDAVSTEIAKRLIQHPDDSDHD